MGQLLNYYLSSLNYPDIPPFMQKYLNTNCIRRLKYVDYFCGMYSASPDVYNFAEKISRFNHSLSVALLIYRYTYNREKALAGLFHDVGTPCFSHVIDYMNGDYATQESTEALTERIIREDKSVIRCLEQDCISIEDIIDCKKYPIVDSPRPSLCADRLDGLILSGIGWGKCVSKLDIDLILSNLTICKNEFGKEEFGFISTTAATRLYEISLEIDRLCHSKEDNYMMELLARITRLGIQYGLFSYEDLYTLADKDAFRILERCNIPEITLQLDIFRTIHRNEIPTISLPPTKKREINPLVKGKRLIV